MPVPVVEIITFIASETLLADDSLINGTTDYIKNAEGSISVFHGYETEDPSRVYLFVVWEKYEYFEKLISSESFPTFRDHFRTLGIDPSLRHILFDVDATSTFSAPITEIATFAPKEGHTQDEINALIQQLRRDNGHLIAGMHPSPSWGKVKQNTDHILAIGWDTIEAHQIWSKILAVSKVIKQLDEISESSVKHVVLHQA